MCCIEGRREGQGRARDRPGNRVTVERGQLEGLEHCLVVLLLVADHELVEKLLLDAAGLDHLERAGANVLQVLAGLLGAEQGEIGAVRPGRLEGVVDLREILP